MGSFKKTEFLFTVPELEKMNVQLQEVTSAYETHSEQLVEKATKVAATYAPVVQRLSESLSSLDVLAAFARASLTAPCSFVRPASDNGTGKFTIKGATHILVVANTDKSFVANDLCMGEDGTRLHLITGPNMGGKSTYIRSVALIALLNQIGCFVPCQHAVLPVFDSIMCRVGASDMQLRGISTFMAEMLEAACILTTATDRSLVIVDELGRGTAAVDTASNKLTFLYALCDGVADQSYGAHVAELAGFPAKVVESSRKRAKEFEAGAETLSRRAKGAHGGGDAMEYVLGAHNEDEFVQRASEQLPQLRAFACSA